ncbi:MAG: hypothetical protein ACYS9X_12595 [Planctomycetota bacterium]|jgi:hypothetical protein
MKRPAPREVAFTAIGIAGVAVIFLPFVLDYSPLYMLAGTALTNWPIIVMALVPFLSFFILSSIVRQALFSPLTKWEVRAAYALALAALVATTFLMLFLLLTGGGDSAIDDAVIIPSVFILAAGSGVVLAATRKGRVPPTTHSHVAMLIAWMPNAAFGLLFFGSEGGWSVGFYLAILVFAGYAVEATLRVRAALRSDQDPGAEAPTS